MRLGAGKLVGNSLWRRMDKLVFNNVRGLWKTLLYCTINASRTPMGDLMPESIKFLKKKNTSYKVVTKTLR